MKWQIFHVNHTSYSSFTPATSLSLSHSLVFLYATIQSIQSSILQNISMYSTIFLSFHLLQRIARCNERHCSTTARPAHHLPFLFHSLFAADERTQQHRTHTHTSIQVPLITLVPLCTVRTVSQLERARECVCLYTVHILCIAYTTGQCSQFPNQICNLMPRQRKLMRTRIRIQNGKPFSLRA